MNVWVRFQVQVLDGTIRAARFNVYGCPYTVAAVDWAAQWLEGRPSGALEALNMRERRKALHVPVERLGKLLLIEDAAGAVPAGTRACKRTPRKLTMTIVLTENAAERVRGYLQRRGRGVGLRLGIKKTGCSGYAYVIGYADSIDPDDVVFEERGVRVVVDNASLKLIDGTQVDFVKEGINEAFKFRNPNVKGECGCGESFSV